MNTAPKTRPLPLSIIDAYGNSGVYQNALFDPVQTHGVYGLTPDTIEAVKKELKEKGATRFRTVKANNWNKKTKQGFLILCYKSPLTNNLL